MTYLPQEDLKFEGGGGLTFQIHLKGHGGVLGKLWANQVVACLLLLRIRYLGDGIPLTLDTKCGGNTCANFVIFQVCSRVIK